MARGVSRLAAAALTSLVLLWPAALRGQGGAADVRAAEMALRQALAARDAEGLRSLLAADFRAVSGADLDGEGWLQQVLGLCGGGSASVADEVLAVQEGIAVVWYEEVVTLDPPCIPAVQRSRVAHVWVMRGAGWRLALRTIQPLQPQPLQRQTNWAGAVELTTLSVRGNVNTFTFGSSGEVGWQHGRSRTNGRVSFLRTSTAEGEGGHSVDAFVRQARTVTAVVELFGRAAYQRDLFAGIQHRYGLDAGVGLLLARNGHRLQATFGAGSTHEQRVNTEDESTGVGTAGVQYRLALSAGTIVTEDALVTASLQHGSRWRMDNTVAVTSVLRQPLSLRASYATKYVNKPVPGFLRLDAILSVGLVARF